MLFSCKKPVSYCTENPDDCVDVRKVKEYFYFEHGSYWVYEEENSGMRDSVYVIETYSDPTSVIFQTRLQSTYNGYDYVYWTTGVDPSVKNNVAKKSVQSTRVIRAKTKPGDFIDEQTCFLFYPREGLETTTSYISGGGVENYHVGALKIESIYDNYSLAGSNFTNVVFISEEFTSIEEGQPTNHYYSPNIGLVKKELLDSNQIWNLVNYHIEN